MLKQILIFHVGLVCGMALLLQVQDSVAATEYACRVSATKTGSDANKACQNEIKLVEFFLHV